MRRNLLSIDWNRETTASIPDYYMIDRSWAMCFNFEFSIDRLSFLQFTCWRRTCVVFKSNVFFVDFKYSQLKALSSFSTMSVYFVLCYLCLWCCVLSFFSTHDVWRKFTSSKKLLFLRRIIYVISINKSYVRLWTESHELYRFSVSGIFCSIIALNKFKS